MSELAPEMQAIKEKMKKVWSTGDFGVIAKIIEEGGRNFINRLNIKPTDKVLDAACGNGNLSIPAAKLGAVVTGIDFVPDLIRQANAKAKTEGLNVKFDIGDVEALPYRDNEFDVVVTMFGAMFAPRPEVTVSELLRVCKQGGRVAMANWTREGTVGESFKINASYNPPPPNLPSPLEWGNEEIVKKRFGTGVSDLKLKRQILKMHVPMSPSDVAGHFIEYFGPTRVTFMSLDKESQARFRDDLTKFWQKYNKATDGTTKIDAEYLEVVGTKAGK